MIKKSVKCSAWIEKKPLTGHVKDRMVTARDYIPEMRKLVEEQAKSGTMSVNVYLIHCASTAYGMTCRRLKHWRGACAAF